jgi:flagellar hook protein FlgE
VDCGTLDYVNGSLLGYGLTTKPTSSPTLMTVKSAGTTSLITGGLEASTTDLATEISEMITTQRGYQANTRIVTVTDSMLEELVNMKR